MRLIEDYSLLPFMTPRQYYYPRVVLQSYHSMTSRGSDSPRELQFSIDDRRGVLRAADISAALGLRIPPANTDGSSTGQGHHCWTSILPEAAPASDAVDRPFIPYELVPTSALRTAEGSHLGGSLSDLGGFLVQFP